MVRRSVIVLTAVLVASTLAFAGCGDYASLRIDDATAERRSDDRVTVTVTVRSGGMYDWSEHDPYCLRVTWFEPGSSGETEGDSSELAHYDPEVDTEVDALRNCFTETIPLRETITHEIISTVAIPAPADTSIRITVELELEGGGRAEHKLVLRDPVTIFCP